MNPGGDSEACPCPAGCSVDIGFSSWSTGTLNLYAAQPGAFDEADVALASVFAAHAAVATSAARREENLERKADSRDLGFAGERVLADERKDGLHGQ